MENEEKKLLSTIYVLTNPRELKIIGRKKSDSSTVVCSYSDISNAESEYKPKWFLKEEKAREYLDTICENQEEKEKWQLNKFEFEEIPNTEFVTKLLFATLMY